MPPRWLPCVGSANFAALSRSATSGLSTHSFELPANVASSSTRLSLSSPICPDDASPCPTLALFVPTAS
eukprot:3591563-Prymnesium_polylepis.1